MNSKPILAVLVALALAGLASPATADHVPSHNEYIGGGSVPGVGVGLTICEGGNKGDSDQPTEYGIGGACLLTNNLGAFVFVDDDLHGGWDFLAGCGLSGSEGISEGIAGSAPNPCPGGTANTHHIVVWAAIGATTGCTWVGGAGTSCPK